MKYLDEYRDPAAVQQRVKAIEAITTRPHTLMEVCGGQTHSIVKYGIDTLIPDAITLIHGPGCPVCVTPVNLIDHAIAIAEESGVIFCSFGDMLRVPGSATDLLQVKAEGADVRMVYSPLDAVRIAQENPEREVVFFAVGFETTAPANALAVYQAHQEGIKNFSILSSHVLVPPALHAILQSPQSRVQGFLAAGHVCAVTGYHAYHEIAEQYHVPIVVTGFEPLDLLQGIYHCVAQLEQGTHRVENQYARSVSEAGNVKAQELMETVFTVTDREWRGLGTLPESGLALRENFAAFDAALRYPLTTPSPGEDARCISGAILQGHKKPCDCPEFAKACTPERPLGAPMVSNEGACAAYYRYRRSAPALKDK